MKPILFSLSPSASHSSCGRWWALMAAGFLAACGGESPGPSIAVIPKGTTHQFWKTVHAGAVKASREEGIPIVWQGPHQEDDRKGQIEVVQNFISRNIAAIVLAPLDKTALIRPVETAAKRGIPVVIMDSGLESELPDSFVATDNYTAGKLGARMLADLLNGEGEVLLVPYLEGSASTMNRERGFLDGLKEYAPDIRLLSSNQYAGPTSESAFKVAQNLLNKYPEVDGVFTSCEPPAYGLLRALQSAGLAGSVRFVGFDTSEALLDALRRKEVDGLVVQDPFRIGYLSVKAAAALIRGAEVDRRVDTGARLIHRGNLDSAHIAELLHPDLEKWLSE